LSLLLIFISAVFAFYGCGDSNVTPAPVPTAVSPTAVPTIIPGNGVVAGQVIGNTGSPVGNATVEYTEITPATAGDLSVSQTEVCTTDSNGYFNFQYRSGSGTLRIFDSSGDFFNNIPLTIQQEGVTLLNFPAGQQVFCFLDQLSFQLDGNNTGNSAWGSVTLGVPGGSPDVRYFNMRVGEKWVACNIPVTPDNFSVDSFFDVFFSIDLGIEAGTAINSIQAFPLLSNEPLTSPPPVVFNIPVGQDILTFNSGLTGFPVELFLPSVISGGKVQNANSARLENYDPNTQNQEAGLNECVPVAASNSLKYLDNNSTTDISPTTSIDNMKDATGWDADGCGIDWADKKNNYMKAHDHPISTTNTTGFETALQAIKDGKDVELSGGWHAAMVTGISKTDDGKWSVEISHDTKQGKAGGTKTETIIYDPATGKFSGSPGFFDGSIFRFFTIESII